MTSSPATPIRILSVEDHPVVREGLATIIGSQTDMALVAQAANAEEAIAEFRRHRPDITLMDLRLPGTNGTDTLIAIRGEFPKARIIMLSMSDGDAEIQRALRSGASAYMLKSMPKDRLLACIRAVHAGRKYVPEEVAARLAEHLGEEDPSARELEVFTADPRRPSQQADRRSARDCRNNREFPHQESRRQAGCERPDARGHHRGQTWVAGRGLIAG
jgi:DNA-binding NarL/FixJ family response regulator